MGRLSALLAAATLSFGCIYATAQEIKVQHNTPTARDFGPSDIRSGGKNFKPSAINQRQTMTVAAIPPVPQTNTSIATVFRKPVDTSLQVTQNYNTAPTWAGGGVDGGWCLSTSEPNNNYSTPDTCTAAGQGNKWLFNHAGVDFSNGAEGSAIFPIAHGRVLDKYPAGSPDSHGYGNRIRVQHTLPNGTFIYSIYGHVKTDVYWDNLNVGDLVNPDTRIATVSGTGGYPSHLHLETGNTVHRTVGYYTGSLINVNEAANYFSSNLINPLVLIGDRTNYELGIAQGKGFIPILLNRQVSTKSGYVRSGGQYFSLSDAVARGILHPYILWKQSDGTLKQNTNYALDRLILGPGTEWGVYAFQNVEEVAFFYPDFTIDPDQRAREEMDKLAHTVSEFVITSQDRESYNGNYKNDGQYLWRSMLYNTSNGTKIQIVHLTDLVNPIYRTMKYSRPDGTSSGWLQCF